MATLKPYTKYLCPVGGVSHKSIWTGAYERPGPNDGVCVCGEQMIEEESTKDGRRYRLTFETIAPVDAAEYEALRGRHVWPTLNPEQWDRLSWHPVTREADVPGEIKDQYEQLVAWAESHEQPIRNVQLLHSMATDWEPVHAGEGL